MCHVGDKPRDKPRDESLTDHTGCGVTGSTPCGPLQSFKELGADICGF